MINNIKACSAYRAEKINTAQEEANNSRAARTNPDRIRTIKVIRVKHY